jgi:hypothetical protein
MDVIIVSEPNNTRHFLDVDETVRSGVLTGRQRVPGGWMWDSMLLWFCPKNMNTKFHHKRPDSRSNPRGHLSISDTVPQCHRLAHQTDPTARCSGLLNRTHRASQTVEERNHNIWVVTLLNQISKANEWETWIEITRNYVSALFVYLLSCTNFGTGRALQNGWPSSGTLHRVVS